MALLTRVVSIPDWYSGLAGIYMHNIRMPGSYASSLP